MNDFVTAMQLHAAMNAGDINRFIYGSMGSYGYLGLVALVLLIVLLIIFTDISPMFHDGFTVFSPSFHCRELDNDDHADAFTA